MDKNSFISISALLYFLLLRQQLELELKIAREEEVKEAMLYELKDS